MQHVRREEQERRGAGSQQSGVWRLLGRESESQVKEVMEVGLAARPQPAMRSKSSSLSL